jgi:aspartokinase-like uncharacterized kinase
VKICLILIAGTSVLSAQSTISRYERDINGNRVEMTSSSVSAKGERTEKLQSINGRQIPLEQSEEKVLSESPGGRVVERIVRKYDRNGQLASTEKVKIEEQKLPNGGSSVKETTSRSDINGNFVEAERRTKETRVSGSTTTTEIAVSRPTLNGGFETAEKRTAVAEKSGDKEQTNEVIQRIGSDGRFHDAIREVSVKTQSGNQTQEQRAIYEPGQTGQLELARQVVSTSTKRPDGTEVSEVNLYSRSADGHAQAQGAPTQIKEQQIIERTHAADGSVIETLSVRRPNGSDPNKLGDLRKLSETVCKGKCE